MALRTTDGAFSFYPQNPYIGGIQDGGGTINLPGTGWDGGFGGGGGGIDLGGTTIGGKDVTTLVDDIINDGVDAVADFLEDQGLSPQLAQTLAQTGKQLGVSGLNSVLSGGSLGGSVPSGVPSEPLTDGPTAGTVWADRDFSGTSLTLKPGLYNFDDLNARGLHDAITSVKVREGFEVHLFRDVENGQPAGMKSVLKGPEEVAELSSLQDAISAIAVRPIPDEDTTGDGGTDGTESGVDAGTAIVAGVLAWAAWSFWM